MRVPSARVALRIWSSIGNGVLHFVQLTALGGFSAEEFCGLVDVVNAHAAPGEIAAVEFNVSCHNVNFPFETILEDVLA